AGQPCAGFDWRQAPASNMDSLAGREEFYRGRSRWRGRDGNINGWAGIAREVNELATTLDLVCSEWEFPVVRPGSALLLLSLWAFLPSASATEAETTNSSRPVVLRSLATPAPSTQKMIERLAKIRNSLDPV